MKITIADFDYTKSDGDTTHRRILVLGRPSDSYFGVEVDSEKDIDRYAAYLLEKEEMDEKLKKKHKINDATVRYRRFKEDGITVLAEDKREV